MFISPIQFSGRRNRDAEDVAVQMRNLMQRQVAGTERPPYGKIILDARHPEVVHEWMFSKKARTPKGNKILLPARQVDILSLEAQPSQIVVHAKVTPQQGKAEPRFVTTRFTDFGKDKPLTIQDNDGKKRRIQPSMPAFRREKEVLHSMLTAASDTLASISAHRDSINPNKSSKTGFMFFPNDPRNHTTRSQFVNQLQTLITGVQQLVNRLNPDAHTMAGKSLSEKLLMLPNGASLKFLIPRSRAKSDQTLHSIGSSPDRPNIIVTMQDASRGTISYETPLITPKRGYPLQSLSYTEPFVPGQPSMSMSRDLTTERPEERRELIKTFMHVMQLAVETLGKIPDAVVRLQMPGPDTDSTKKAA